MTDSILNSIKKALQIDESYEVFDDVIIMHINTQFSVLHSVGASNGTPYMITGPEEEWSEYLGNVTQAQMVKTYIYLRVRLLFDPPTTSFTIDAFKKQADELEWRLSIMELDFNPDADTINPFANLVEDPNDPGMYLIVEGGERA